MKTRIPSLNPSFGNASIGKPSVGKVLAAATAAGLFLAGCINDPSPSSGDSGDMTATVEGRVQGDIAPAAMGKIAAGSGSAGIEGAVVTVARIKPDGSFEAVSTAEVKTDAQGRFSVHTAVHDVRELVVRAGKDGKEWKAVVSAKAKQGGVIACRPLDTESSLEADVLARVRGGSGGEAVSFADIASHIDAGMAVIAEGKAGMEAYFSAQVQAEAKARIAALSGASAHFTLAQIDKANEARMDAEAGLESSLDAGVNLTAEAKAKIDSGFHAAEIKAWTDAGIAFDQVKRADDSCYHAMTELSAGATVDAEAKLAWLHKLTLDFGATAVAAGFTLSGIVEGGVSGAVVQVATVKADGSLEILGDIKTQTDAQGGFTLNTAAKLPDSVVVLVTKDDAKLMILLDTASSKTVQVGAETTVEAKLFQQLLKDGSAGLLTSGEIRTHVDSAAAADIEGDDSAIAHVLGGLELAAKAQGAFLIDNGFSANATAESGLDAGTFAKSLQVYAQTLSYASVGIAADAKLSLMKDAHAKAAAALCAAAEAQVKAAGAGEASVKALVQAGAALQASIRAAASAEAIPSAYDGYHAAVTAALKAALLLQASAIESADAEIRAQDGARAELMAKVKAAADAQAAAKAHEAFSATVDAQVKAALGTGLGAPGEAQVKAAAQAMILANMCG